MQPAVSRAYICGLMTTWLDLERELSAWRNTGLTPTFWWRDDDAEAATPALDRLIGLAERHGAPLHLAVVPSGVCAGLAERLARASEVYTLQHGYAHINREPPGARASELGQHRPLAYQIADLRLGWQRLAEAGLPNLLPAFAPPWNRIADRTVARLPELGYRLLSTCHARKSPSPVQGLHQVNIHVDPIRWKGGAGFRGTAATLEILVRHLRERRTGQADRDEPTGLSTHHLQTDEPVWAFLDELLTRLGPGSGAEWVRLARLTGSAG